MMADYGKLLRQIRREQETEERVRCMDAADIVEWIHELEDKIESLEEDLEAAQEDAHE